MPGWEGYDLAIVGMGPVGAVAANLAGKAGLRTLIIERGDEPYRLPRAIVFDAEIMRIFAAIGLGDQIAAATRPLGGSVYLGSDHKPIRTFTARERNHPLKGHQSNLFYQPQLEAILREGLKRFNNVDVMTGCTVHSVQSEDDRVVIHHDAGSEVAASVLACDGASSTVRKALGITLDDFGFEERWLVVDSHVSGPMHWPADYGIPDSVRDGRFSLMVCDPRRPATIIPGRGDHRRWEFMLLDGESDEAVLSDDWLETELSRWIAPCDVEIVRAAIYRFRALVAHDWQLGRIFLCGDAAHQTPPFFGQGMCHGIRDVAQLVWRIELALRGKAGPALLTSYQTEREPHVRAIIAASVAAGAEVCKLDPGEALARDQAFREAERLRTQSVAMADVVPPIIAGLVASGGGMRLPEFVTEGSSGPFHFDELLGGRFSLLTRNENQLGIVDERWSEIGGQTITVAASNGEIGSWLDENEVQWAIVRPDRYVYARGRDQSQLDGAIAALLAVVASEIPASKGQKREEVAAR